MKKKIHIGVEENLHARMKDFCDKYGLPITDFIRLAIAEKLDRLEAARGHEKGVSE